MVSVASVGFAFRPLVVVAALVGLVLLLSPPVLGLDVDASVSSSDASLDGIDDAPPAEAGSTLDKVNTDPDDLVRTAHGAAERVRGTATETLPSGLPSESLEPTEGVLGTKSAGRTAAPDDTTRVWESDPATTGAMALGGVGLFGLLFWAKNALGLAGSRFLLAPLFSRIDKDDMLDNDGRELLFNLVQNEPGISLSELSERSGLGWGTTVYHLGRLEQAGFVSSMRQGQTRHFFEKGNAVAAQKNAIAVLKNQTAGDMARFLLAQPGATQSAIGQALGIKAPVVTKYVKRLHGEGLVDVAPSGRSKVITPTSQLSAAMTHLDTPVGSLGVARPQLADAPMASAA